MHLQTVSFFSSFYRLGKRLLHQQVHQRALATTILMVINQRTITVHEVECQITTNTKKTLETD